MLDYFYCPNFSSRTWSKTPPVCVVVPSMLTSILLEALAVWLNFGVKVSTLRAGSALAWTMRCM